MHAIDILGRMDEASLNLYWNSLCLSPAPPPTQEYSTAVASTLEEVPTGTSTRSTAVLYRSSTTRSSSRIRLTDKTGY